jgi:hypothetical protein
MSTAFDFMAAHPILTVILACIVFGSLSDAFRRSRK